MGAPQVNQCIGQIALVVRDYDEAIRFYVQTLGFELKEDKPLTEQGKRWVVVAPRGRGSTRLLLARAAAAEQALERWRSSRTCTETYGTSSNRRTRDWTVGVPRR